MNYIKVLYIALVLTILAGCAFTNVTLYNDNIKYSPTKSDKIKVFREVPTGIEFEKIGEITVDNVTFWDDAEIELKNEAGKLGADAVYIIDTKSIKRGGISGETLLVAGVAIKYKNK